MLLTVAPGDVATLGRRGGLNLKRRPPEAVAFGVGEGLGEVLYVRATDVLS
jgi:hypothetical protein